MKKAITATALVGLVGLFYACKKDDNPTTIPTTVQLTSTLINQPGSTSTVSTSVTSTASFSANLDQSQTTNVLSYTVTYAGIAPTAITLDPVATSTSTTSGTSTFSNSILLAGSYPTVTTSPGSGTSTTPGSGTSTTPGSGTSTTPGSGTSTTPGSGTSTTPGSGTSTTPGSGTSTTPGSGTSTTPGSGTAVSFTSPVSGTVSLSQSRGDSLRRGYYQISIRSQAYPNGILTGIIQPR